MAEQTVWPVWKRVAFRFAFTFWFLFDNGLSLILFVWPWLQKHVSHWLESPMEALTLWTGKHLFHLTGEAASMHPTAALTLQHMNLPETLLMSRGFHWVQEYPMNR